MKVLGVDASLRSSGWAVVEGDRRSQRAAAFGTIRTRVGEPLEITLAAIASALEEIIASHQPQVLALEDIYAWKDTRTALLLGHVRGAVILLCHRKGLAVAQYSATCIKETVTGYGRAEKAQVQNMVTRTLSLPETPQNDAADALAAALTHIFRSAPPAGTAR